MNSGQADIQSIKALFKKSYHTLRRRWIISIVLCALSALLTGTFLLFLAESIAYLTPEIKSAFWFFLLLSAFLISFVLAKWNKINTFSSFYRKAADETGLPELRYALDLLEHRDGNPGRLAEMAIRQNILSVSQKNPQDKLHQYVKKSRITKNLRQLTVVSSLSLLLFLFGLFSFDEAWYRSTVFWVQFERPNPYHYTIAPGDTTIEQGTSYSLKAHFYGREPDVVQVGIRSASEKQPRIQGMIRQAEGEYRSGETELFEDTEFFVRMGRFQSETKKVRVETLPRLQDFSVTVKPPAYTKKKEETHRYPFSHVDAIAGSEITLRSRLNKPLEKLSLVSEKAGDTLSVTFDSTFTAQMLAVKDDRIHFVMRDRFNLYNSNPFRFNLRVTDDKPPYVNILNPAPYTQSVVGKTLPLLYEYEDDFGFTALSLHYRLYKAYMDEPEKGTLSLSVPDRLRGLGEYDWEISKMNLSPMDRLEFWLEITDNNAFSGFQTTRSSVHQIEIPSLADRFFEQEKKEEDIKNRFEEIDEAYRQMQENLERLRDDIRSRPDDVWDHEQLIEDIKDQRTDVEEQIENLRRDFEELTREMEEQGLLSKETLERYKELEQLISEIDDPDILDFLKQMQENLERFDQSQLREQLDKISFNEERYRERLERTLELFKSLRMNAELEKMSHLLDDLAKQEMGLSEKEQFGEEEVGRQEQIREQIEKLSEQMEQLPEKSPERSKKEMEAFREEMKQKMQELLDKLDDNIEMMKEGSSDTSEIRGQQQEMSQEMQQLSQQMNQMKMQMQQQTISINLAALQYILETLILLSKEQEEIAHRTSGLTANSPGFIDQARRQRNVEGQFGMITDSLFQVSAEIPQFSNRINDRKREIERHMQRSVNYLVDRDRSKALAEERLALGGLNEAGTMIADLFEQLNNMQNGGGGGGAMSLQDMMEQMEGLSQSQVDLNQQIQDFINDLQGERLTQDHMDRLEQMAHQQNQIREQLQQLQRSGELSGDRLMSEIERLTNEMEDAINELRGGSTDDIMVERQQNILSRMLEIEESVHKRDEDEEERLGTTAEDYEARDIQTLTMEKLRKEIRSGIESGHYTRFRRDYQRLIDRYFELMEEFLESTETRPER